MKPEMITLKHGDATIKMPSSHLARLAMASVFAQVLPAANVPVLPVTGVPTLGGYWPGQGGVNAGLVRGQDGTRDYYLIVPTGDDLGELKFGAYGDEVEGAGSAWDGQANTRALIASGKGCPAAEAAAAFTCDGHNDFYLPARRELQIAEANVSEVFGNGWHWSSTQRSASFAFYLYFEGGVQGNLAKNHELRVRPVRRVFI